MQDILVVQVVESVAYFVEFGCCLLLLKLLLDFDVLVQRPFLHILHQDVKVSTVAEEAVHFDDVGMVCVEVDLQLLHKLIDHQP